MSVHKVLVYSFGLALLLVVSPRVLAETGSNSAMPNDHEKMEKPDFERKEKIEKMEPLMRVVGKDFNDASPEAKRLELEELKRKMQLQRETFKSNLSLLRDEKKKNTVVSFDDKIASISSRRTQKMTESVQQLIVILDRVASKAAEAKNQGKDTTSVDKALLEAEKALAVAKTTIASQSAKQYLIPVKDDAAVKENIGQTMKELQTDLRTTHQAVVMAKQAVMLAVKELKQLTAPNQTN